MVLIALLALSLAQEPAAAAPAPHEALLFKSGQAYLVRDVPVAAGAASARMLLPEGIHGTLWLGSSTLTLVSARSLLADAGVEQEVGDLVGILRMAVGREVTLEVLGGGDGGGNQFVSGRILRLLETPPVQAAGAVPMPGRPSVLVLDHLVIPVDRVVGATLRFDPGAAAWSYRAPVRRPVLEATLQPAAQAGALSFSSMANGLAWAPSYVLQLGAEGQGRLVGKAVIVNDLEDLAETHVRLVVGYPNIQFAEVRDPLFPEVALSQFQAMLNQPQGQERLGVALQNYSANTARFDSMPSGPPQATPGETAEDLYLYDVGTVSLKRGERAYLPLLEQAVEYKHRFDWELPDKVDRYANFSPGEEAEDPPVWHVLRVCNHGAAPWTTAPILITGELGPLAQSSLDYTPVGGENGVRLTQALDIVGKSLEVRADEARAQRESVVLFGGSYERVRVKGTLELVNHSRRAAPMHVVKHVSGDLAATPEGAAVAGEAQGLGQINASRTLTWEFELAAGGTWKAEYEYEVLIRR